MIGLKSSLIGVFARHPVAANLLMILLFLSGIWGYKQINTELLPTIELPWVTVLIVYPGASPKDVENSVMMPVEKQIASVESVEKYFSFSARGIAVIILQFKQGTNLNDALDDVKKRVDSARNLPEEIENPVINRVERYDLISRVILEGAGDREELRQLAYDYKQQLLKAGIARVTINGLADQEIVINVPSSVLPQLKKTLGDIGNSINSQSIDSPAGAIGRLDAPQQLRFDQKARTAIEFEALPINIDNNGNHVKLSDIAKIKRQDKEGEVTLSAEGHPIVELAIYRTYEQDTFKVTKILNTWLDKARVITPKGVSLRVYDERWQLVTDRIKLLIRNAGLGFIFVFISLSLFLNLRTAFWVALGIPTAYFGSILVLYLFGSTINMLTLFAFIITLGIIVDDAIVVGENAVFRLQKGEKVMDACINAGEKMFVPVLASSLTTIAALLPLFIIGGFVGKLMAEIPLAIICVIIASLVECFLILPGHLSHSLARKNIKKVTKVRAYLDNGFNRFREDHFRKWIHYALQFRVTVVIFPFLVVLLISTLLTSGRINFTFFPKLESSNIFANVDFYVGTPKEKIDHYMQHLRTALFSAAKELGENEKMIDTAIIYHNTGINDYSKGQSDKRAALNIELIDPDKRGVPNKTLIDTWRKYIKLSPDVEQMDIRQRRGGPSGRDVELDISGGDYTTLKIVADKLKERLKQFKGVSNINDNLPIGKEDLLFSLTPEAKAAGLTETSVATQLYHAYSGVVLNVINEPNHQIDVRLSLPKRERYTTHSLDVFTIIMPNGNAVPLSAVATTKVIKGFDYLRHVAGEAAITVSADVDSKLNNANSINAILKKSVIPLLEQDYHVSFSFAGISVEQEQTLNDMTYSLYIGLALIFIILAWVFGSYLWPIAVMFAIPFGLVGAVIGHWVMGYDISVFSLFGFFALSGIVVNDSIILLIRYKELKQETKDHTKAIVDACCDRLRPVILTSITTIAGLMPAMFERALSTQFLVPVAISIVFGMAFATLLILFFVPCLLSILESIQLRTRSWLVHLKWQ